MKAINLHIGKALEIDATIAESPMERATHNPLS